MSRGCGGGSYEADLSWCYDAVEDVSRTFAITVETLEKPMSDRICVGYLLCRVADTVEDAGHIPPEAQSTVLETYQQTLDPESDVDAASFRSTVDPWLPDEPQQTDDWEVVANVERVVGAFEGMPEKTQDALRDPIMELVEGMSMFIDRYDDSGGLRIGTVEELEEYCWYAAGTVGELITNLVAPDADPKDEETLRDTARSFALLLQLVNVAKDVSDDYHEENNVYLPETWLNEVGVDQNEVCAPENRSAVRTVIGRVTDRAAGYLDDAQAYLEAMPLTKGNTLAAWAVPYLLAVGTIRELRKRPEDVLEHGGVKVPRQEVFALIHAFEKEEINPERIGALRSTIEKQPFHEAQ